MFQTYPVIESIISMEITHKENQFLIVKIISNEEFSTPELVITYNESVEIFSLKSYYYSHSLEDTYFFYEYIAYDQEIFHEFLKKQERGLFHNNSNILEAAAGFFYIDPFTHQVSIDSLNPPDVPIICGDVTFKNSITKINRSYKNPKEQILTELFFPPVAHGEIVCVKIPPPMYIYIDILSQQIAMGIHMKEGDYFLELPISYTYQKVLRYLPKEGGDRRKLTYFLDKSIKKSLLDLWGILWQITRNSILYENRREVLEIFLMGVPTNLSLKSYIFYENKYYKIIEITLQTPPSRSHIIGVAMSLDILPLQEQNICVDLPKINFLWEDIFYVGANHQLFLKKKIHKTQYIDESYITKYL